MQDDLVRPRQLTPRLSQRVENAILKAMRANPNERFTDCPDFMNALVDPDQVQQTAKLERPGDTDPAPREKIETKSSANRRAAVRYPSSLDSTCHPMARVKERAWAGKVQDVSSTGVCLVLGRRFEPGTLLTAEFKGKRRGTQSTRLVRVLRVIEKIKGKYLIGCAFQRPLSDGELQAMV
jgi:hypothetical protein